MFDNKPTSRIKDEVNDKSSVSASHNNNREITQQHKCVCTSEGIKGFAASLREDANPSNYQENI